MATFEHGGKSFNKSFFRNITEEEAVRKLKHLYDHNTIRKIWKIANGKSKPNYITEEAKPKRKRTSKKKSED